MQVQPITDRVPACFGVCCPKHGQCARYAAVDGTTDGLVIATCDSGAKTWPLFRIEVQHDEVPA